LDLIVSGTKLLEELGEKPSNVISDQPVLDNLDHLQQCLAYSMQNCAGLERFFSNRSLFRVITDAADNIDHEVSVLAPVSFVITSDSILLVAMLL